MAKKNRTPPVTKSPPLTLLQRLGVHEMKYVDLVKRLPNEFNGTGAMRLGQNGRETKAFKEAVKKPLAKRLNYINRLRKEAGMERITGRMLQQGQGYSAPGAVPYE